ncbi:MAG: HD domain-containing protein [Desulfuromonadaceae bacterium]|nr:HD domain-containing protein [Desulfuromonadaceae bacterium]
MSVIIPFLKTIFPPSLHDQVFLVGGTVRDLLLGRDSRDTDLVAALSPEEILVLGFRRVEASSSATIYFKHHPDFGNIEVTRINTVDDLAGDLFRRDFTINAMAYDMNGCHLDPLGGREDLHAGLLRACSQQSFTGDPLRVFRAFRFEADGWRMTPETAALIRREEWASAFSGMPIERFSSELLKALAGKSPEKFFQRMIEFNVGAEFLPELFRMPQIPAGPLQHHPEGDLFTHSIQVLQRVATVSADQLARFCALFHDLGKLATDPARYPKHHGHDISGFAMAVDFCTRLHLSTEYRNALAWTSALHGKANLWETLRDATKISMAEQAIKGGIVQILPLVAAADKTGNQPMDGWDAAVRVAGMNTVELGIDREKLEAMPIGKRPAYMLQKRIEALKGLEPPRQNHGFS